MGVSGSALLTKLGAVAAHRRPFAGLFQRIVQAQLSALPDDGPIVEIGAGDGQLTACLPPAMLRRAMITEPSPEAVDRLAARFEGANVVRTSAERLPLDAEGAAAVVACCVLDVVEDLEATVTELRRVLRPGGVFLHVLDMSTDLNVLIAEIATLSDLCLLPNVFTDPMHTPWPEDLLVVPRAQISAVIVAAPDPATARLLAGYLAAFEHSPAAATEAFNGLHESREGRQRLFEGFRAAMQNATAENRATFRSFRGRPLSSARVFHDRILHALDDRFRIETADIVRASERAPADATSPGTARRSIVGYTQSGRFAARTDEAYAVVELGVHILRAVRA